MYTEYKKHGKKYIDIIAEFSSQTNIKFGGRTHNFLDILGQSGHFYITISADDLTVNYHPWPDKFMEIAKLADAINDATDNKLQIGIHYSYGDYSLYILKAGEYLKSIFTVLPSLTDVELSGGDLIGWHDNISVEIEIEGR